MSERVLGEWAEQAACRGSDPNLWFHPGGRGVPASETYAAARLVCGECPVKADCLEHAIVAGETEGMWGGLTPKERRRSKLCVECGARVQPPATKLCSDECRKVRARRQSRESSLRYVP